MDPDWIGDPDGDDDESSPLGFNDPSVWEPGDGEEDDG
jgi:hypothetical protein